MIKHFLYGLFFLISPAGVGASSTPNNALPIEISFWHSMAGNLGSEINRLVDGFNQSQSLYRIKPMYKGNYIESLTAFAAAFRAQQAPAIIQVFEVGTNTMLLPKGIIKPLNELMQEQNKTLPLKDFFPALRAYYSENDRIMAMPFNTSIPVMFYNADVLNQLGYTRFPSTWDELEKLAALLKKRGYPCAYTTAYPAWILMESYAVIHGLALVDHQSGQAVLDNPQQLKFIKRIKYWQTMHYFEYGGKGDDATVLFTSGRCAMLSQSSGSYQSLASIVPFHLGVAVMPLDTSVSSHRVTSALGGAALWAVAGQSAEVNAGIMAFFMYLAQPSVQQQWYQTTGYLPLGMSGSFEAITAGSSHPVLQLAKQDLTRPVEEVISTRFNAQHQIRIINDDTLEMIFAGIKTPEEAMKMAVTRAKLMSGRYAKNNASTTASAPSLQKERQHLLGKEKDQRG